MLSSILSSYPSLKRGSTRSRRKYRSFIAWDINEARVKLSRLIVNAEPSDDAELFPLGRTLKRWHNDILGYLHKMDHQCLC